MLVSESLIKTSTHHLAPERSGIVGSVGIFFRCDSGTAPWYLLSRHIESAKRALIRLFLFTV